MIQTIGSLFSGIGGLELGLERALGARVAWQVEIDPFCRRVLTKHWPDVPKHEDVRSVSSANLPRVDLICGGFPCQDISVAGKGEGLKGARSGLFYEYMRIVRDLRPSVIVMENVSALRSRGFEEVARELATCGYDAEWDCIPASAVGAPHRRDRIFVVATDSQRYGVRIEQRRRSGEGWHRARVPRYAREAGIAPDAHGNGREGFAQRDDGPEVGSYGDHAHGRPLAWNAPDTHGTSREGMWSASGVHAEFSDAHSPSPHPSWHDERGWIATSAVRGMDDGISDRMDRPRRKRPPLDRDRLRALGNAVVPQVAEHIGRVVAEIVKLPVLALATPGLELPMLSPTQVELSACEMAWWFKYEEKLPDIPKKASSDGFAIDRLVMAAIQSRTLPPLGSEWGPVVRAALHGLEWDTRALIPQVMISGCPFGGAFFGGWDENRPCAIDALDETTGVLDDRGNPLPFVQDLKTTSDKKWIKSEKTLRVNLQALVYARAASLRFLARYGYLPAVVHMRWVYAIRDCENPRVYPVAWTFSQEDIDAGERLWEPRIARTLEIACRAKEKSLRKEDCSKNFDKCGDFGGCSFGPKGHGACEMSLVEIYSSYSRKKDTSMTALDQTQIQGLLQNTGVLPAQNGQGGPQYPQNTQPGQQGAGQTLLPQGSLGELQSPHQVLQGQAQQYAPPQGQAQQYAPPQQYAQPPQYAPPQGGAPQFAPTSLPPPQPNQTQAPQYAQPPQYQQQPVPQQYQQQPQAAPPQQNFDPGQVQQYLAAQPGMPQQGQQPPPAASTPAPAPGAKKRGRKTNAERAAMAAAQGLPAPNGGEDEDELADAIDTIVDSIVSRVVAALQRR